MVVVVGAGGAVVGGDVGGAVTTGGGRASPAESPSRRRSHLAGVTVWGDFGRHDDDGVARGRTSGDEDHESARRCRPLACTRLRLTIAPSRPWSAVRPRRSYRFIMTQQVHPRHPQVSSTLGHRHLEPDREPVLHARRHRLGGVRVGDERRPRQQVTDGYVDVA